MTFTKSSNRNVVGQLYKIRETESTNDLFLTSYLGLILPRHLTGDLTLSAQLILVLCNAMVQSLVTVSLYINHKAKHMTECQKITKHQKTSNFYLLSRQILQTGNSVWLESG